MKILIVGATYMDNFGDMLFAKLIVEKLKEQAEIRFYLTSDYCRDFVGEQNLSDFDVKDADALLYMPGGYLGDRSDTSLITTYRWFARYFPIGLHYSRKHKPIMILAVDAGPCKYWIMRKVIKRICNASVLTIVRNDDSKKFLVDELGITSKSVVVTSDYAQTLVDYKTPKTQIIQDFQNIKKKKILLHINECEAARKVVIPALKRFCELHMGEYEIIVASDQHYPNDGDTFEKVKKAVQTAVHYYRYGGNPLELCSVIKCCDCVITYKLHVGIVAATYSKSVIPIPEHYRKVEKYYRQINQEDRVVPLKDATEDNILDKLEQYVEKKIILPKEIYQKASDNNTYIESFMTAVKKRG